MKKTTGDQYLVKKINKSIVLDTIQRKSPISRASISELTGLNKATVSIMVQELIDEHFVTESGPGVSSGGRKPVILLFNEKAGYSIGIDLGVNYILGVLTDLQGSIVQECHLTLNTSKLESVISMLHEVIQTLTNACPPSKYGIIGIGIGVPGIVNREGLILSAPNLKWNNVPLKTMIESAYDYPVAVDNEANCGALGEKEFGAGKQSKDLLYISVGIGIGSGLIVQNELFRGRSGYAGEVGHVSIEMDGPTCSCGNRGCWELYASEQALLRDLGLSLEAAQEDVQLRHILERASKQDIAVLEALNRAGFYLGVGISNLINLFSPETIIIGNRMSEFRQWLHPVVMETISNRSLPFAKQEVTVEFAERGVYSAALGATSLAIAHFFSKMRASVD